MSRLHGTKDFWIGALRTEGPAFAAAVAEAPPETPVLSCPGWTVSDLAHHLTRVYVWARTVVTAGTASRPERHDPEPPAGLTPAQWYGQEYERLLTLFEALDPEAPAWNFAPQPKKAAFWPRRMAHETAVHRWDAQLAIGAGEKGHDRGTSLPGDLLSPKRAHLC